MIIGLTKTVAKIPSSYVLPLPNEGLQMAGLLKPLPWLGCPVVHFLHGKLRRGGCHEVQSTNQALSTEPGFDKKSLTCWREHVWVWHRVQVRWVCRCSSLSHSPGFSQDFERKLGFSLAVASLGVWSRLCEACFDSPQLLAITCSFSPSARLSSNGHLIRCTCSKQTAFTSAILCPEIFKPRCGLKRGSSSLPGPPLGLIQVLLWWWKQVWEWPNLSVSGILWLTTSLHVEYFHSQSMTPQHSTPFSRPWWQMSW